MKLCFPRQRRGKRKVLSTFARDDIRSITVACGFIARSHAIDVFVELLMVGGTDDDAPVAVTHATEDRGEAEAEDDRYHDGTELVGHDAFENHDARLTKCSFYFPCLFF